MCVCVWSRAPRRNQCPDTRAVTSEFNKTVGAVFIRKPGESHSPVSLSPVSFSCSFAHGSFLRLMHNICSTAALFLLPQGESTAILCIIDAPYLPHEIRVVYACRRRHAIGRIFIPRKYFGVRKLPSSRRDSRYIHGALILKRIL